MPHLGLKPLPLCLILSGPLLACVAEAESGQCDSDADCPQRGQICEVETHVCIAESVDYDSTLAMPDPNFMSAVVPFFRGKVCAPPPEFQSGSELPLRMLPCYHPCLTTESSRAKVFHTRECRGGDCNGFSVFSFEADGTDCPADAFSRFDPAMCQYDLNLGGKHPPFELNGMPINGLFSLEIPFLTNADVWQIHKFDPNNASAACTEKCVGNPKQDSCLKSCLIRELAESYVLQPGRVIEFNMTPEGPATPAECPVDDPACPCVEVGF